MKNWRYTLMLGAVAAAAAGTLGARAQDESAGLDCERQIIGGVLPDCPAVLTAVGDMRTTPASRGFESDASSYRMEVVTPPSESTVSGDDVMVRATVVPGLAAGDRIELLLDGEPIAPASKSLELQVSGLARGTHLVQARIIDSTGNVGSVSPASPFYAGGAP